MGYKRKLANEAIFVGLTLIPFVSFMEDRYENKYVAIFLAGALYHLTAEFSGLNDWYLKNGASTLHKINETYETAHQDYKPNQGGAYVL